MSWPVGSHRHDRTAPTWTRQTSAYLLGMLMDRVARQIGALLAPRFAHILIGSCPRTLIRIGMLPVLWQRAYYRSPEMRKENFPALFPETRLLKSTTCGFKTVITNETSFSRMLDRQPGSSSLQSLEVHRGRAAEDIEVNNASVEQELHDKASVGCLFSPRKPSSEQKLVSSVCARCYSKYSCAREAALGKEARHGGPHLIFSTQTYPCQHYQGRKRQLVYWGLSAAT